MSLIGQHEFGKHVFVAGDGDRVLVLHDRATVDIKGGDQDILDMILGGPTRVLGTQLPLGLGIKVGILSL